jgi:hypothetical protein
MMATPLIDLVAAAALVVCWCSAAGGYITGEG